MVLINTDKFDAVFINDFAGQVASSEIADLLNHCFFFLGAGSMQLTLHFLAS